MQGTTTTTSCLTAVLSKSWGGGAGAGPVQQFSRVWVKCASKSRRRLRTRRPNVAGVGVVANSKCNAASSGLLWKVH
jgi:hypothetical protein